MITPITATFPALNFPKEVDYPTQEDWAAFSATAELNYGILSGTWSDKSEEFKAQTNNLALEIKAIGENAINAITLNTVDDLATYTGTGLVIVKDINRGGIFVSKTEVDIDPNTGSVYAVNGGIVFAKLGGGFWVRQYSGAVDVKWFGWNESGGEDNYNIMKDYIKSTYVKKEYKTINTLKMFSTQWEAGNNYPIAFYGDSTTDGATTTGHISSVISSTGASDFNAIITINESPSSYPRVLEDYLTHRLLYKTAQCYNAGFDSQSLLDGTGQFSDFGTKAFHRVFFGNSLGLNNVDYSDVKGIVLTWGITDIINNNDINAILNRYEWKMRLLITECFERGIQPYIADCTYSTVRVGSSASDRNNYETELVISSINEKLRSEYNLEKLSLKEPLEMYVANSKNNRFLDVIASDGVHMTDKGHRMVASYYASLIHPLVKSFKGDEDYKFTPANIYSILPKELTASNSWELIDTSLLTANSSYAWRFSTLSGGVFCYRLAIFCEKKMDLLYDMLHIVSATNRDNTTHPKISINPLVNGTESTALASADWESNVDTCSSDYFLGTLDIGLNIINVISATNPIGGNIMGFLKVKKEYDYNVLYSYMDGDNRRRRFMNSLPNISFSNATPRRLWADKVFSQKCYSYNISERALSFKINNINNRDILFNASKRYSDFDSFNILRIKGTSVKLLYATVVSGVEVEYEIASVTASISFDTYVNESFVLNMQPTSSGHTLYVQRYTTTSTAILAGPLAVTTSSQNGFPNGGYSFGIQKNTVDTIPIIVSGIVDDFTY